MQLISRGGLRRLSKEGAATLISQCIVALAGLYGVRLLTQLAPQSVLGNATLIIGAMGLLRNLIIAPVANGQIRFHPEYIHRGRASWFVHRITAITWSLNRIATVILVIGCLVWMLAGSLARRNGWTWFPAESPTLLVTAILACSFSIETAKMLRLSRLSAERRQFRSAIWNSLDSLLVLAGPILAMLILKTLDSYLLGVLVGSGLALVCVGIVNFPPPEADRPGVAEPSSQELKTALMAYGLPFIPLAVISFVSNLGDRYLIKAMMGSDSVAIYSMCYALANKPLGLINSLFSTLARPILFDAVSRGNHAKGRKVFLLWLLGVLGSGALVVLGMALFGSLLARWFLAESYREHAVPIFIWVSLGYVLSNGCTVVENRMMSLMRTRSMIFPQALAAIANVGINLLMIPRYGIVGAAIATAITFALQLVAELWMLLNTRAATKA